MEKSRYCIWVMCESPELTAGLKTIAQRLLGGLFDNASSVKRQPVQRDRRVRR
jgi:hypothetical protein